MPDANGKTSLAKGNYKIDPNNGGFSNFSDDTYSYYNSLGDHADKGELGLFGGEVIPVYTNVENGLGVLISTNAQQIYIRPVQP